MITLMNSPIFVNNARLYEAEILGEHRVNPLIVHEIILPSLHTNQEEIPVAVPIEMLEERTPENPLGELVIETLNDHAEHRFVVEVIFRQIPPVNLPPRFRDLYQKALFVFDRMFRPLIKLDFIISGH